MPVLAACVCAILSAIAAIHLYWALGGEAGKAASIPTSGGRPMLKPGPGLTALVAGALLVAAALVAAASGLLPVPAPAWLLRAATGLLAVVFLARAVGDFRYVGFFKRVRGTTFASRDTWLYSPLCLALAAMTAAVAVA